MKNYVGKKIKGFEFKEGTDLVTWNYAKKELVGKIGTIVVQQESHVYVYFKDDDKDGWAYPISMVEEHLVNEEKDTIVEAVRDDLQRRSELGIKKYNTTLDRTDLSEIDWLNHAYEEALDLALYLKKTITLKQESK